MLHFYVSNMFSIFIKTAYYNYKVIGYIPFNVDNVHAHDRRFSHATCLRALQSFIRVESSIRLL